MTYEETINYLYNSVPMFQKVGASAYKEGLDNSHALDLHFNFPHKKYKTIHIAGTNGKGSCSHTLASILQDAGYKVGLYTSPHLKDFRERIRVNGKCIEKQYVIDFVESEKDFFEPLHPSFFELTTALAFKYFAEQDIDIAVIETGLGGRLDCTNIINPIVSIITNISFDHTGFLGDTLEKIAFEKAGIIKPNTPVVIGETTEGTRKVFINKAKETQSPISFAENNTEILSSDINGSGIVYTTRRYGKLFGELGGIYQTLNTRTVLTAIDVLKSLNIKISNENIKNGLAQVTASTGLMGRWQTVGKAPLVICDTGHNVGGWQYLSRQLAQQHCKTMRIVFGMVDDKDIETVMSMLPKHALYYFTKASTHRAIDEKVIKQIGDRLELQSKTFANVKEAFDTALKESDPNDFLFIGGSSYIVSDYFTDCHKE
ncbi:MAG: bifunctional folylpolyglutamate synthase/dihydrofolate synthase [Paraprevotella sp.]|nr:bifunctional folylpolyglutamate synthase/dihydrofolate synthase [Paraprevotella sp.]